MIQTTAVKAAGVRAFRTFIQALIAVSVTTLSAAALGDVDAAWALLTAVVGAAASALISFLQGILAGLPETNLPDYQNAAEGNVVE